MKNAYNILVIRIPNSFCFLQMSLNQKYTKNRKTESIKLMSNTSNILNQRLICRVKGDAGEYEAWGIDWASQKVKIYRASAFEIIPFQKIKEIHRHNQKN